jgi:Na+-driven multidrug efflux pump
VALLDCIVGRIGLALLLGVYFGMGIMGFWLGNAISGTIPLLVGGAYFISGAWKKRASVPAQA